MKKFDVGRFGDLSRLTAAALLGVAMTTVALPTAAFAQRYGDEAQRGPPPSEDDLDDGASDLGPPEGARDNAYDGPPSGLPDGDLDGKSRASQAEGPPPGVAPADYFYDALKPLGRWVEHWKYGLVWYPNDVDEDWRPYSVGRWVLTDEYGWLWDSEEPWGWAVFHYGRWSLDEDWGWIWVPGNVWGPAWVDWREGESHVGWAPLPPEVVWRGNAFDYRGVDLEAQRYRTSWVFVPAAQLTAAGVYRYIAPRSRNLRYVQRSRRTTNYAVVNRRFVNRSIDARRVERVTGRPVVSARVIDASRPDLDRRRRSDDRRDGPQRGAGPGGVSVQIGDVSIFRPFDRGRRRDNVDPAALPSTAGVAGASGGRLRSGNRAETGGQGTRGGQRGEGQGPRGPRQGQTPPVPANVPAPVPATATPPVAGAPAAGAPAVGAPAVAAPAAGQPSGTP